MKLQLIPTSVDHVFTTFLKTLLISFQAFLCSTGAAMLLVNAGAIWQRWKFSNQATLAVAEILDWIGVPLKRQVKLKVILCSVVAVIYMLDLATVPLFTAIKQK